jgi:hypothetical protein
MVSTTRAMSAQLKNNRNYTHFLKKFLGQKNPHSKETQQKYIMHGKLSSMLTLRSVMECA